MVLIETYCVGSTMRPCRSFETGQTLRLSHGRVSRIVYVGCSNLNPLRPQELRHDIKHCTL